MRKHYTRLVFIVFALLLIAFLVWAQNDPTVYITRTGTKYHVIGCRYFRNHTEGVNAVTLYLMGSNDRSLIQKEFIYWG